MPLVKTQAEGINLADTFAFTGGVSGISTVTTANSGGVSVSGNAEADFLNLPSGITRIMVNFYGVSASNTGGYDLAILIRLGTSSGLKSSGYSNTSANISTAYTDSTGFPVFGTGSSNAVSGIATINHMGGNAFVSSHSIRYASSNIATGGGHVDLGGTLDRIRVQLWSGGNFDSGLVNIMYE
mgnify:FL=1